ncbi:glycine cleavage system aminomethyltransferase GcvT [Variovorax boronicumulans]|uniref:aminomethyltransferase n=2 Tax=Variovorax boronicumulans TaxID=436515 RepID=A0A1E7TZJ7_9BURK|nr:glycine cleavage system aminomethyltransferase GcvT [Variovorax boronicumulans]ATA54207.1 glycine cleavage system aminomethyltransferase T [Variovorax boronicumulans]MDP9909711.1 aminomethyltransferase [Variovorax boronicumulans]OEZ29237.1 glycine cleavage system protein T [Variovorax boronicumulans]
MAASSASDAQLLKTPLYDLHVELGARMVPFAGYSMPVQYPAGLMAEHKHTRDAAGLFDISHMGQLRLVGPDAAAAFETLMPVDVVDLPAGKQRYGLLLNDEGGILDDLMFFNEGNGSLFVIVNGACKVADIAHIQARIGARCQVQPLPDHALLALQGPQAAATLARLSPGIERFVFMTGGAVQIGGIAAFVTRSGYTGEDGFEISVAAKDADALARLLLAQPEVKPVGLGARNSLRLEAGLCLYGNDIDTTTTPVEASLNWAIQKVRRAGGAREGGFPGAAKVLAQLAAVASGAAGHTDHKTLTRKRVGLVALERIPVRDGTLLQSLEGHDIGAVTSGLLGPTADRCVAMGYVAAAFAEPGTRVQAIVRGKPVPMEVSTMPFVPTRYYRG